MNDAEHRWESRIERARELLSQQQSFAPALRLYAFTLEFQRDVATTSKSILNPELPVPRQIDIPFACSQMPSILDVALVHGPERVRLRAKVLRDEGEPLWRRLFAHALEQDKEAQREIDDYFVRACLQPIAENLQSQLAPEHNSKGSSCPACAGCPQLAILRAEGEGASRSLLCSFCLREWSFRRIVCPYCGEEDKEKLPRYSADGFTHVHVEGCDTCKHYLKAVDMSIDGHAVPLVDEAATAVLDVWATDHGYTKIVPNLLGF